MAGSGNSSPARGTDRGQVSWPSTPSSRALSCAVATTRSLDDEDVRSPTEGATPRRATLTAGMVLGGRYQLEAHLGTGGMGTVWAARDRLLDLRVALKF